jgi:arylsulfatase A-like enzyme
MAQPGRIPKGRVVSDLVSAYDVFPTLLAYLGLPDDDSSARRPGRSYAPLLQGRPQPSQEAIVVFDEYGPVRMVRTHDWKYVQRHPDGPHELYDLRADPGEQRNLIDAPLHTAVRNELRRTLSEWFERYSDPEIDGTRWAVTGAGQLRRPTADMTPEAAFASVPIAALKKAV